MESEVRGGFAAQLTKVAGDAQTVTLSWPILEYSGRPDSEPEFEMMHWWVDITMGITDDSIDERLTVGLLELWTLPLGGSSTDALDAASADSAEYLALFSADGELLDEVVDQFEALFATGLLILNRAFVHPSLRGHDLGAWAAAQAIRGLTFGSAEVLVTAYPTPFEKRPGVSREEGAKRLAHYWARAGLEPITACPKLMGQSTGLDVLDDARSALPDIGDFEITVNVSDVIASGRITAGDA